MPEISVIMPVYNMADGQVLERAVNSIQGQTYKDWELIICDDGSTDRTWALLKQMAYSDPRIRLLRHRKNCKAGQARNTCIRAAGGRYIAIMDADDISAPDRLEKQRQYLQENPELAFVGGRGEFFVREVGDDGELYWYCRRPQKKDFLFSLPYVHASMMFRKEALALVHGYDGSRRVLRSEDYDLLLRLYSIGQYGENLPEVLYYIRRDEGQYRRRKYRYRFQEAYVKYKGFQKLGLMPSGLLYAVKPLAVGLIPIRLVTRMQRHYYRKKQ